MAGTNLNNNFALKQRKPLDERTTTRETAEELSAIKYPCPNLRVFVAGVVNAWHEYKLVNGVYTWVSDSNSVISYRDLRDLPSINGKQINEDLSLEDLGIQAKGNYLTDSSLNNYYRKDETLSAIEIDSSYPNNAYLTDELAKKVTAEPNKRLIREDEATKLASAVTSGDLDPYSLKDTKELEEATEILKGENQYIKFFDEAEDVEKKISLPNFILGVTNPVYPTARALVGDKDGKNETFYSEYNYIAGSEKLNINGSIYYPNSGFYKEGNNIILSGAPIPEAGDFMFLEAIYLD